MLLFTMQSLQRQRTGYYVGALLEEIEFKEARNQYLRYQIGVYKSPDKILPAAAGLGLHIIDANKIIPLDKNELKSAH